MRFVLAHVSDVHIGPLPRPRARELMGKRLTGYLNWTRGRHRIHDMAVLARLVGDMKAQRPDHIAMTGDILNIGLPAEFPLGRAWLASLGDPRDVSFVPGNHDAYVRGAMPHLAKTFLPWVGDADGRESMFPYLRVRGEVGLIGLSSGNPTGPFLATGRLGAIQCEAFARLLDEAERRHLVRIVMIHHPPHRSGATLGRHLQDARRVKEVIRRHGADLIIHGHNHRSSVAHIAGPVGRVPVVGVASGSAVPGTVSHRAAYHLFTIEGEAGRPIIRARARGLLPGSRDIGDLGPLPI
jgi:3',5'-cyclic AMP phosphodiesterase CpdA